MSREQREPVVLTIYSDDDTVFTYEHRTSWWMTKPEGREATPIEECLLSLVTHLRAQLAAAENMADYKAMYLDLWDSTQKHYVEREHLRTRAERAEAETAYIRRAFRGAVESDKLAITYQTIGSYRAGLLKTLNALDPRNEGIV